MLNIKIQTMVGISSRK